MDYKTCSAFTEIKNHPLSPGGGKNSERETGLEPATSTLARSRSTN
jgi:hypothetical protein